MRNAQQQYPIFMLAGASVFIALAICIAMSMTTLAPLGDVKFLLASYTLMILVFMCGVHWGQMTQLQDSPMNLFLLSNFLAVLSWLLYVILTAKAFFAMAAFNFCLLLCIDYVLLQNSIIEQAYFQYRVVITFIVTLSLLSSCLLS